MKKIFLAILIMWNNPLGGVEGEKLFFLVKNFFHCYTEMK